MITIKAVLTQSLFFVALLLSMSCEKDKSIEPTFDDLSFQLLLLDTNGVATTTFTEGSDIVFEISMTNNYNDTVFYYEGLKCASMKFKVYQNNVFVGHPHPDNWGCTDDLKLDKIEPKGIIQDHINWLERPENTPLLAGIYIAIFKTRLALKEPKNWKEIELELKFEVN